MQEPRSADQKKSSNGHARGVFASYSPDEPVPLGGYAILLGGYAAALGGFLLARNEALPERVSWGDVVLMGVATHKLSRIVTKDWMTSPIRAPFVVYDGSAGGGEVHEHARGTGMRKALGDLLTCDFCIAPWIAGALGAGLAVAPRVTRLLSAIFGAVAISDALQHAYSAEKRLAEPHPPGR